MLQAIPLLAALDDGDLDQMARSSRPARYAVGELLLDSRAPSREVIAIRSGRAGLELLGADGTAVPIGDLAVGEVIELASASPRDSRNIALRAVTDCEVLAIDPEALGEIGSRNADVAEAFNRVSSIRRRRIERMGRADELMSGETNGSE